MTILWFQDVGVGRGGPHTHEVHARGRSIRSSQNQAQRANIHGFSKGLVSVLKQGGCGADLVI